MKIIGILSVICLIWLLYSYNESNRAVLPPSTNAGAGDAKLEVPATPQPAPPSPRVVVDVYYECLCPDSRYFVLHQLLPAYLKVGSLMDVRMWPYGKASSESTSDGEPGGRKMVQLFIIWSGYSFQCQHGQAECQGNIYHACVAEKVEDQAKMLETIKCMINDNFQPEESARKCANQQRWAGLPTLLCPVWSVILVVCSVDFSSLQTCATGREGEQLHYKAGLKTESLSPKVTFIPTIGNQTAREQVEIISFLSLCYRDKWQST